MDHPVKYIAEPTHVREVALVGGADLAFWQHRLRVENLEPVATEGQAQLLITAANMKFNGVRFTELSFAVRASAPGQPTDEDGVFLIHAFNTSRLFAFFERAFFSTPYYYAHCEVAVSPTAAMELTLAGEMALRAELAATASQGARQPSSTNYICWEGPLYLPSRSSRRNGNGKLFYGKLAGLTQTYPFMPGVDSLSLASSPKCPALQDLIDSTFTPVEWTVRADATHGRSKTFSRPATPMPGLLVG